MEQVRGIGAGWIRIALLGMIAAVIVAALAKPEGASAGVSGVQEAWSVEVGTGLGNRELFNPTLLGVDPVDGSVYIANFSEDFSEYVVKKFSKTGVFEGSANVPRAEEGFFSGLAVDHSLQRFYLLQTEGSSSAQAQKILVFSTQPNGSKVLPPAAVSELPVPQGGEVLNVPDELVVDPSNHDLVISAEDGSGHLIFQRIKSDGTKSDRYTEMGNTIGYGNPLAVGSDGVTYILTSSPGAEPTEALTRAYELPANFTASSTLTPVPGFAAAVTSEQWVRGKFVVAEPPVNGFPIGSSPQMAISSSSEGTTLYWKVFLSESEEESPGEYLIRGFSLEDQATSALYGGSTTGPCKIQTKTAALGAGPDGGLVVLDQGPFSPSGLPPYGLTVTRYGPGGSQCTAPAASFALKSGGSTVTSVPAGTTVTLDGSGSELNSQTLSEMIWTIEGPGGTVTEPVTAPTKTLDHNFAAAGDYTVRLKMRTSLFPNAGTTFAAKAQTLQVTGATPKFKLKVTKAGTGTGTVTGGSPAEPNTINCGTGAGCEHEYDEGGVVTLSAAPSGGSTFAGWSGAGCAGTGTCVVTMSAAKEVTATFNPPAAGGGGTGGTGGGTGAGTGTGTGGGTGGKTQAEIIKEKRQKALKKCRKLHGKAKSRCVKHANEIGKPKKGKKKSRPAAGSGAQAFVGWHLELF